MTVTPQQPVRVNTGISLRVQVNKKQIKQKPTVFTGLMETYFHDFQWIYERLKRVLAVENVVILN
jgi:hypothetical protein